MIIFQRSAAIAPGKTGQAVTFAHEIAAKFKDMSSVDLTVVMPIGGNPNRIAWLAHYNDLAHLDEVSGKMMTDEAYQASIASAAGLFIAGSIADQLWRTM